MLLNDTTLHRRMLEAVLVIHCGNIIRALSRSRMKSVANSYVLRGIFYMCVWGGGGGVVNRNSFLKPTKAKFCTAPSVRTYIKKYTGAT